MKIEVGQKWRYVGTDGKFYTPGNVYAVIREATSDDRYFQLEDDLSDMPHHWTDDDSFHTLFERVDGPVMTVVTTRKEIVIGTYARVNVQLPQRKTDGEVSIYLTDRDGKWSPLDSRTLLNAAELRAAAAVFAELADALDAS